MYDYDISWDYELDKGVPTEIKGYLKNYSRTLKTKLLPELKVFEEFEIHYVLLQPEQLGTYIYGTSEKPIIALDISNHIKACKEYDITLYDALETTMLHELGHAIQQYLGKGFDEDEAEEFAFQYNVLGNIYREILK